MRPDPLLDKLLSAARQTPVSDAVPAGFGTRLQARLRRENLADTTAFWAIGLWRAVIPAVGLVVLSGALHWAQPGTTNPEFLAETTLAADELESVLLSNLDPDETW